MTHIYKIEGMTCGKCVAKAKNELLKIGEITEANIQLADPQATITMNNHIPVSTLQAALFNAGNYTITEAESVVPHEMSKNKISWFSTYKPILLIGAYITGVTVLIEAVSGEFNFHAWMTNFMAAFFLVFSFFKMLDIKGFADSYATYDVIAKKWYGWGYIYAFLELSLGIAYLVNFEPLYTNIFTFALMSISIIGVLQSVLNKRTIQCACLGTVFNLPMSTITIIEDGLMMLMSIVMILSEFNLINIHI